MSQSSIPVLLTTSRYAVHTKHEEKKLSTEGYSNNCSYSVNDLGSLSLDVFQLQKISWDIEIPKGKSPETVSNIMLNILEIAKRNDKTIFGGNHTRLG